MLLCRGALCGPRNERVKIYKGVWGLTISSDKTVIRNKMAYRAAIGIKLRAMMLELSTTMPQIRPVRLRILKQSLEYLINSECPSGRNPELTMLARRLGYI